MRGNVRDLQDRSRGSQQRKHVSLRTSSRRGLPQRKRREEVVEIHKNIP